MPGLAAVAGAREANWVVLIQLLATRQMPLPERAAPAPAGDAVSLATEKASIPPEAVPLVAAKLAAAAPEPNRSLSLSPGAWYELAAAMRHIEMASLRRANSPSQLLLELARVAVELGRHSEALAAARAADAAPGGVREAPLVDAPSLAPSLPAAFAPVTHATAEKDASRPAAAGGIMRDGLPGIARLLRGAGQAVGRLWRRLPLLALFLAWLLLGLGAGLAGRLWPPAADLLSFWGIGFLGLVVLGFLASVRLLALERPPFGVPD